MDVLRKWDPRLPRFTSKSAPPHIQAGSLRPFAMPIIASRNSGKSYLLRDIYRKNDFSSRFDIVIVFSRTLPNGYLRSFMATNTIFHDEYHPTILTELGSHLDSYKNKHGWYPNTLVIYDDINDKSTLYCPHITDIFTRGRHRAMSIIYISQLSQSLPNYWRVNATHVILLKQKGLGLESSVRNYLLDQLDEDDAYTVKGRHSCVKVAANDLAKDVLYRRYHCLVINYEADGSDFRDSILWYLAD